MTGKSKINDISIVFLSLLITFVFKCIKARQVFIFIKYLLNLDKQEQFCFILHNPGFRDDFTISRSHCRLNHYE